jgi:hypothetical protein
MLTTITITRSWAISAWKRRFEKTQSTIPATTVVAVKLTAIPVVLIARRIASSRRPGLGLLLDPITM